MQGTFIFAVIMALLAGISLLTYIGFRSSASGMIAADSAATREAASFSRARERQGYDDRIAAKQFAASIAKWAAIGLGALAGLLIFLSSFWIVGTQNIGIVTSFGKPVGHVSNGPQWTWPWENVTEMDYAVQYTDLEGSQCLTVRIAEQQTACLNVKFRWRIQQAAADDLFRNYKHSTAGVENGLLIPELQNVANTVFDSYDPVGLLNSPVPEGQAGNPTVPQLGTQIGQALGKQIGGQVQVISLFTPNVIYDSLVQNRLNTVLTQKAQTLVAQQAGQTATAQAAANRAISASVSHDPAVLTSRCLDLMGEIIKAGHTPPIGMCNLNGSGTPVIANSNG